MSIACFPKCNGFYLRNVTDNIFNFEILTFWKCGVSKSYWEAKTCHTSLKTWVLRPRIHVKVDQTARMPYLQLRICHSKTYSRGRRYSISARTTFFSVHSNYWQRNSVSNKVEGEDGHARLSIHVHIDTVVCRTALHLYTWICTHIHKWRSAHAQNTDTRHLTLYTFSLKNL